MCRIIDQKSWYCFQIIICLYDLKQAYCFVFAYYTKCVKQCAESETSKLIIIIVASYIVLISVTQWRSRHFNIQHIPARYCGAMLLKYETNSFTRHHRMFNKVLVAPYATNKTRNTGANPLSFQKVHWVILCALHNTRPTALSPIQRMQFYLNLMWNLAWAWCIKYYGQFLGASCRSPRTCPSCSRNSTFSRSSEEVTTFDLIST